MAKKLHNSLIDYLVLVGCDKDTGLIFKDHSIENENLDEILSIPLEPAILSVISYDLATYPSSPSQINTKYPPCKLTKDVSFDLGENNEEINNRHCALKPVEIPIQADILYNLAQFCFPNQAFVSKQILEPFVHSFVLTDMEGKRKFSVSLTYYREFYCSKNNETNMFELLETFSEDEMEEKRNYFQIYVPTSIILMSQYSYFDVLKDCISNIFNSISTGSQDLGSTIEYFAFRLTHFPVPPKSLTRFSLIIETSLNDLFIFLNPADEFENQVFDLSLTLLFNRFTFDDILNVIMGCLSESKMIFISKRAGLLTPILECFMKLIQPFKWLLSYVPLLPVSLLGYIEAPHPFIMGFCTDYQSLKNHLEEDNDLMIIDIDEKRVHQNREFLKFPQGFVNDLRKNFSLIDLNEIETNKILSPSKFDPKFQKKYEKNIRETFNSKICDIFVEFYVEIFGDLNQFVKWQTRKFDKDIYFDSVNEDDLEFYKKVINTSLFEIFISNYIKNVCEDKPDLYHQKLLTKSSEINFLSKLETKSNSSTSFIKPITKTLFLSNPETIVQDLTKELQHANTIFHRDSLLLIRGLYYISINQIKDGFRDLYQIDSKNLFPKELITNNILPTLVNGQIDIIKSQDFYKYSDEFRKITDDDAEKNSMFGNSLNSLELYEDIELLSDLKYDEFTQKLIVLEIRLDNEISKRLFDALTLGNSKLNYTTFEIFIDTYKLKENELNKIKKFLPSNKFRTKEFPLKISNHTLVPNYGIGNLVLTQKCLYLLELGTNRRKVIAEIKDIISIEKAQYSSGFFNSKPALKMNILNEVVHICPDNEVNVWYLLLNELCSSFRIANETKDSSLIQLAAINVILMDTVLQSGLNSLADYSRDLDKSLKHLSYYTLHKFHSTKFNMSKDAKKLLHLKINPSIREYSSQSIESIIYVNIDDLPTVWCAVGNRIKIFDAITWNDETNEIKLDNKITCLMHEPINSKIWISILGNFFYIMDVQTRSFNQKIQVHSDIIICIVNFTLISKVLTASANGEIFVWDTRTLEKVDSFNTFQATGKQLKLIEIKASQKYLLSIYLKQIDLFDEFFQLKNSLKFNNGENNELISCACLNYDKETNEEFLWVGNTVNGIVSVWSLKNFELKMRVGVDDCKGYRSCLSADGLIWAGSKDGRLIIFNSESFECENSLKAHNDSIRSLCSIDNKFVISGSGSRDGSIAIWRPELIKRKTIKGSISKMLIDDNNN